MNEILALAGDGPHLVVDIGCVDMSHRFYADGSVTARRLGDAQTAARHREGVDYPVSNDLIRDRGDYWVEVSGVEASRVDGLRARSVSLTRRLTKIER